MLNMLNMLNKYGLPAAINRPHIKATKKLNLDSDEGKQIVKSETKLILQIHSKTFKKLADM